MMKTRNLLFIGLAVFVASLLLNAPIALLHAKLAPPFTGVGMQPVGLDGTISEGRLSSLQLNNQSVLKNLHWQLRPLSLMLARAAFRLDSTGDLTMDGKAAKLITGGLNIDDLRAAGPLRGLLAVIGDAGIPVDGQFGLALDSARIRSGFLSSMKGEVTINTLRWTLAKDPVVLGDFVMHVTTDEGLITGKVEPLAGPLDVGGEIRIKADRNYEIDVQVKAKPTAEPLVQNLISALGQSDAQGYFHIRSTGNLGGAPAAAGTPPPPGVQPGTVQPDGTLVPSVEQQGGLRPGQPTPSANGLPQ